MKVILKSSYTKSLQHALNNIEYISTKDEILIDKNACTSNQRSYIEALEEKFDENELEDLENRDLFYDNPTKKNASAYLSELEDAFTSTKTDAMTSLNYISERKGSNGLFNKRGNCSLLEAKQMFLEHSNNHNEALFYNKIIAIKGEDAKRVDFEDIESFQNLVNNMMPVFANKMGIELKNLQWFAAVHDHKNPHVHISMFDTTNRAYLKKNDLNYFRKIIAKEIYKDEMQQKANDFYIKRDNLVDKFKTLDNFKFDKKDISLLKSASNMIFISSGKKQYEYLSKETKEIVNKVIKNCIFKDELNKKMFFDATKASKNYTSYYSKDDYFSKSIFNPGKFDKKIIQNSVIKSLIENYDVIDKIYNSKPFVYYRSKGEVINTLKSSRTDLTKKIMEDFSKKVSFDDISLEEKGLIFRFCYAKGLRESFLEKKLEEKELNISDKDLDIFKKYSSFLNEKVFHEVISDADYVRINNIFGYETRELKKNAIEEIFDKFSKELAVEVSELGSINDFFDKNIFKYDDLGDIHKNMINNVVIDFFKNNSAANLLLNEYLVKKCKMMYLNQEENDDLIPKYDDFESKHLDQLKSDFFEGKEIKKIHQFIYSSLSTAKKDINEIFINKQHKELNKWSEIFLKSKAIDFSKKLYSDIPSKYDIICKVKTIAKALTISDNNMGSGDIKKTLEYLLKNDSNTKVYFTDEIIGKAIDKLATEKIIAETKDNPFLLSKKEIEFLSLASDHEINTTLDSSDFNNSSSNALNITIGVMRILRSLTHEEKPNNQQGRQKNKNKYLDDDKDLISR